MIKVNIQVSGAYDIIIGDGILADIGKYVKEHIKGDNIVIVCDSTVYGCCGYYVHPMLLNAGYNVHLYMLPSGEQYKNGETYLSLMNYLAQHGITRSDGLVALGGGVAGDLCGFAAATYMRGISYIQVPTTLLAAVDSSVGGKTAIDLPSGKNLVGAFYQPKLVICDYATLRTLPENIFRDGCAEVIKYGVLCDTELFERLEETPINEQIEWAIARCVQDKCDYVRQDEFDTGKRNCLNLGHTIGHAVEQCSNYMVSHGSAVAIGLAMITRAAAAKGHCSAQCRDRVLALLEKHGLPTWPDYTADELFDAAIMDKKRRNDSITLVVPKAIGECALMNIPITELKDWIEKGF